MRRHEGSVTATASAPKSQAGALIDQGYDARGMNEPSEPRPEPSSGDGSLTVEQLLVRYLPALRAFVRLRIDPNLREREAESDIVQSTCRAILQHKSRFEFGGEEGFRRWLFTSAMRTLIDKAARAQTQKRSGARKQLDDASAELICRSLSSPSAVAEGREARERLERAFDTLGDDEREVIALARVAGLPHSEIATVLGRSEAATRVLLHRSLLRLAKALEAPDRTEPRPGRE